MFEQWINRIRNRWKDGRLRWQAGVGMVGILLLAAGGFWYLHSHSKRPSQDRWQEILHQEESESTKPSNDSQSESSLDSSREKQSSVVVVDVKGAVQDPGVYEVPTGSRVQDALEAAGGVTGEADPLLINRAQPLTDGQMIYVAKKGEEMPASMTDQAAIGAGSGVADTAKVDLNTASSEELQTLPGVGEKRAADIIAYREQEGPFQRIEDLGKVSGFGEKSLEKVKDHVRVGP